MSSFMAAASIRWITSSAGIFDFTACYTGRRPCVPSIRGCGETRPGLTVCSDSLPQRGRRRVMPFIDANGVSLHYELAGAGGPAVVLLHELGGTLYSWDAVAPPLAAHRRVLRYDQRGAGLSEKVRQEFSNDVLVDDFE